MEGYAAMCHLLIVLLISWVSWASKTGYASVDHSLCKRVVLKFIPFAKIDLCRIQNADEDFVYNVTYSSPEHGLYHVHRYFSLNPFRPINQSNNGLDRTNCPPHSTVCLISKVSSDCSYGNTDDTCARPSVTADSYGCNTTSALQPGDLEGPTAALHTSSGPCYYCKRDSHQTVPPLQSIFYFYCDERVEGLGAPILSIPPRQDKPTAVFKWNTSIACYQTRRKEVCLNVNRARPFCPFHCNTSIRHKAYSFPSTKKNLNKTIETKGGKTTYSFGFCNGFQDGNCNKDTIICKTTSRPSESGEQDNQVVSVISFKDRIRMVIRPNGYVWRVYEDKNAGEFLAVVSFNCTQGREDAIEEVFLDSNGKLVPWFVMNGGGFCANASPSTSKPPTSSSTSNPIPMLYADLIAAGAFILFVVFAFIWYIKWKRPRPPAPDPIIPPDPPDPPTSTDEQGTSSSTTPYPSSSSSSSSWTFGRHSTPFSSPLTVLSEGYGDPSSSDEERSRPATERDPLLSRTKTLAKQHQPDTRLRESQSTPHKTTAAYSNHTKRKSQEQNC